ncbi:MAG: hypothetical protein ABSH39_06285 [Candidatus Acidiferrum sp.]
MTPALEGFGTTNVYVGIVIYGALFLITIGKFRTNRSAVIGLDTVSIISGLVLLADLDESVPTWMRFILASLIGLTGLTLVGFIAAHAWKSSHAEQTGGSTSDE